MYSPIPNNNNNNNKYNYNSNSKRITIVLHKALFARLQDRSDYEGRSMSNLCAYLLERAMSDPENP